MLLLLENLSDYDWLQISIEIISVINSLFEYDTHDNDNTLMQFMVNMPKTQILEYLISLQSLLTINIIGEEIDLTLLEETIKIMDLLWRTNKLKPIHEQIHDKEFLNDSINNNVDLKESMKIWAQ